MTTIPNYEALEIPQKLTPFFSRIMHLTVDTAAPIVIPARPTGRIYIGFMPSGSATASANGQRFSISAGQAHISGQLNVFDAEYTINGQVSHYLAECTPLGAFKFLGKDLGTTINYCDVFAPEHKYEDNVASFYQLLHYLNKNTTDVESKIAASVAKIDSTHGDINFAELCEALNISQRHFRRQFIKFIGIAPKPYALIRKVIHVLQLLAEQPNANILDLVHDTGFYDQAHLTKVFQLYLRTSPKKLKLDEDGVLQSIVAGS